MKTKFITQLSEGSIYLIIIIFLWRIILLIEKKQPDIGMIIYFVILCFTYTFSKNIE